MKIQKTLSFLAILAFSMSILSSNDEVFAFVVENSTVETVRTIPTETEGTYQHFIKICAGENDRLELPNILISSDLETQRQQVQAKIPPGFCSYQNFTVVAEDPSSITVELIETTNF